MLGLGFNEIIIIAAVVFFLFFGPEKILNLARSMGKVTSEYKRGKIEAEKEYKKAKKELDL